MKLFNGKRLILLVLLLASITGVEAVSLSNSGGGTWQYYREITITNSLDTLKDYQLFLQLSGSYLPVTRSDGADIRFTDTKDKELPYWIEDYSSSSALIWVKVPNIPANSKTKIRMYYGNPDASAVSNGDDTFDYFDMGDKIETWKTVSFGDGVSKQDNSIGNPAPSYIVSSTTLNDYGYMYKKIGIKDEQILEFDFMAIGSVPVLDVAIMVNSTGYGQHFRIETRESAFSGFSWKNSWTTFQWGAPISGTREKVNTWYKGKVVIDSPEMNGWIGMNIEPSHVILNSQDNEYIGIEWSGRIDNIRLRKYAIDNPIVAIGSEKVLHADISITSSPPGAEVLIDGLSKGFAMPTLIIYDLMLGSHNIVCRLSGYSDYLITVELSSESMVSEKCELKEVTPTMTDTSAPTTTSTATPTITSTSITAETATETDTPMPAAATSTILATKTAATPNISQKSVINGRIIDAKTSEPIFGATISSGIESDSTGMDGKYELKVRSGNHDLTVTRPDYESITRSVNVPEDGLNNVDFSLTPIPPVISWYLIFIVLAVLLSGGIYLVKKKKRGSTRCLKCGAKAGEGNSYCEECGEAL